MKKIFFYVMVSFSLITIWAQNNRIIPFKINKKIGFVNSNLEIVMEPSFDSIEEWNDNTFVLYSEQRKTKVLFNEFGAKNIQNIILLGNGYYSICTGTDTVIYDENSNRIRFLNNLQHDHNSTYNYMIVFNGANENILTKDGTYLFDDKKILEIYSYDPLYNTALCRYKSKGFCLITTEGIVNKVSFQFAIRSFNEGLVFGKNLQNGVLGFYDMNCNLIIKANIKKDSDMDDWNWFPSATDGVIVLTKDDNDFILLSRSQTFYSDNWHIIDKKGTILAKGIKADYIYPFSDEVAVLKICQDAQWKYCLINKKGECITKEKYDEMSSSINGYCMAKKDGVDYLICSKNGNIYKCENLIRK
ncbi:MAG: WG repeat-containing protein [Treponema sp.]|nr:WG repeat-containing protein [Treponema sp.]